MSDESAIGTLQRAMSARTDGHHLDPDAGRTAWADAHAARRPGLRPAIAVAATVVAMAGAATAVTVARASGGGTGPGAAPTCAGTVTNSPLPAWAADGFSPDALRTPHVFGRSGDITAILFVRLRAHQPAGTNNKILWVAKDGAGPLHIAARLGRSHTSAVRTVPLGPSFLDLPAAGCWQLTLRWAGRTDTIGLQYGP